MIDKIEQLLIIYSVIIINSNASECYDINFKFMRKLEFFFRSAGFCSHFGTQMLWFDSRRSIFVFQKFSVLSAMHLYFSQMFPWQNLSFFEKQANQKC